MVGLSEGVGGCGSGNPDIFLSSRQVVRMAARAEGGFGGEVIGVGGFLAGLLLAVPTLTGFVL